MKVLLISPASDMTTQIRHAFELEGHIVRYINDRGLARWPLVWQTVRHIPPLRRLRNLLFDVHVMLRARRFQPELILICKGMALREPTLRRLRKMGVCLANWFPENGRNEPYRTWLKGSIGLYDLFFTFDSSLLEFQKHYAHTRIIYLPFGVGDPSTSPPELTGADHRKYDSDICFIGARYPDRERILSQLSEWDIKIFGWKGWERSSLADRYHGPLDAHESAKAYRCAKIVLNMNMLPPVNGVNVKTFEICAAAGFQLTDFRADLIGLFSEDIELVVYRSDQELLEKIHRYLADPAARERIAWAGRRRVQRDHTMRQRIRTIVQAV